MAVITWPTTLRAPAEWALSQARYDMLENSDATGHMAARLLGPPRWRVSLRCGDAFTLQQAGIYEAMLLQLRGSVNHLQLHDPVRAAPQGTLRGAPVLAATAAAGATTLSIGNATATNLLIGGGFEIDAGLNGIADQWVEYSSGTQTISGHALVPGVNSPWAQRISFTELGAGTTDRVGYISLPRAITAGIGYTLAYDASCTDAGMETRCSLLWYTSGDVFISSDSPTAAALGTTTARYTVTATAPPTAAYVRARLWVQENTLGAGVYSATFDNAHIGVQTEGTAFGPAATVLAGDWLQLGTGLGASQLVKVVAAATANDNGVMSVAIEPPLRIQYASSTVVTWDKPATYFKQLGSPQWSYRPAVRQKQSGFALDLLESWT